MLGPGRQAAVRAFLGPAARACALPTPEWPFHRHLTPDDPPGPGEGPGAPGIWIRGLHRAFPAAQTSGTRLVLTQSTYQMQRWLDWADAHPGAAVAADADRPALARCAPEVFAGRGPWSRIPVSTLDDGGHEDPLDEPASSGLHRAFSQPDPEARLSACLAAAAADGGNAALHLACASVLMELQRLDAAHEALTQALALAGDWEAAHFELGKLWLRAEETERAVSAFAEAGRLMPSFAAAFSNLGAALGELDRSDEALDALRQALAFDPAGHPVVNNLGAVYRELGRLEEAEAAFRRVIELAPAFVFGHYNLGHTLFLHGRFAEARDAYAEGMRRDPQKNPRQASRLAVARAAAGDASGAVADLDALAERVPAEAMRDLMQEAESTLRALSAIAGVDAAGVARVLERVAATLRS